MAINTIVLVSVHILSVRFVSMQKLTVDLLKGVYIKLTQRLKNIQELEIYEQEMQYWLIISNLSLKKELLIHVMDWQSINT